MTKKRYELLDDFGLSPQEADAIATSPFCVVAVWRYENRATYSRAKKKSFSDDYRDAFQLKNYGAPLIVTEDVITATVSTTKSNHVGQASVNLRAGMNYIHEVFPGDHIAIWIVNDKPSFETVVGNLEKGIAANAHDSGLKFWGRVSSVRKSIAQQPNGPRATTYSLSAASFTELDAGIYYEPYLSASESRLATGFLKYTGLAIGEILKSDTKGGFPTISTNKILPILFNTFCGSGVPKNLGLNLGPTTGFNPDITKGLDNPYSLIVPSPVAATLGVTTGSKSDGSVSYADIVELIHGIQKYKTDPSSPPPRGFDVGNQKGNYIASVFSPDNTAAVTGVPSSGRARFTQNDQLGTFYASVPEFNGLKTVWNILEQFINKVTNEIYATLRVSPQGGAIFPTVVCRQLPFSSGLVSENLQIKTPQSVPYRPAPTEYKTPTIQSLTTKNQVSPLAPYKETELKTVLTRFDELPRWVAHPSLLLSLDVGRSDALRFNMVQIYGEGGTKGSHTPTQQMLTAPPIFDDLDIYRNGIRPYNATVPCSQQDTLNKSAAQWMHIQADFLMGGHLKLTGSASLIGIQSPICIGDNFELDNHLFHIESITHGFSVSPNGNKTFRTNLSLSYGVRLDETKEDADLFSGAKKEDLTTHDAAQSTEFEDK